MKSARWVITYIVMASVGLWVAFFMSLKFMTPGHTQTPSPTPAAQQMLPPAPGDLPPAFSQEAQAPIPPPPTEPPVPPPPEVPGTAPGVPSVPVEQAAPVVVPQFASDDQYTYDPTGRRDPFKPYRGYRPVPSTGPKADSTDPLQKWDLNRFNVVAIMWEVRQPRAMVKDPDGNVHMIGKSTKIGRNAGHVVAIREGEIVVVEDIDNEGVRTKEVKILELKK